MLARVPHFSTSILLCNHIITSQVTFSVGDIRRRLSRDSVGPRKMFTRDPTDPSGSIELHVHVYRVAEHFKGINL